MLDGLFCHCLPVDLFSSLAGCVSILYIHPGCLNTRHTNIDQTGVARLGLCWRPGRVHQARSRIQPGTSEPPWSAHRTKRLVRSSQSVWRARGHFHGFPGAAVPAPLPSAVSGLWYTHALPPCFPRHAQPCTGHGEFWKLQMDSIYTTPTREVGACQDARGCVPECHVGFNAMVTWKHQTLLCLAKQGCFPLRTCRLGAGDSPD